MHPLRIPFALKHTPVGKKAPRKFVARCRRPVTAYDRVESVSFGSRHAKKNRGVDLSSPRTKVFLKQYGERRTGTNYVRSLLEANVPNLVVLMHVLGDKHSVPARLLTPDCKSQEEAYQWAKTITERAHARYTNPNDPAQQAYIRSIALELAAAVRAEKLGFIISIKDPYAWAASISAYNGWLPHGLPRAPTPRSMSAWKMKIAAKVKEIWALRYLSAACQEFNRKYWSWHALHEQFKTRSSIVRYEDLLSDPPCVLRSIADKHGLELTPAQILTPSETVLWAEWDHLPPPASHERFDASYYHEKKYLERLTPAMRDMITESIDWTLLSKFQYHPL